MCSAAALKTPCIQDILTAGAVTNKPCDPREKKVLLNIFFFEVGAIIKKKIL
jgi:hypothetical protein